MPKTSKKTKTSKGTGLKRKFDLSNRRVQFFVTIAIVALLGGGWFTYKSFAAPGTRYATYNIGSNTLEGSPQGGGTWSVTNDNMSKNGIPVLLIDGPAFAQAKVGNTMVGTSGNGKYYVTCTLAKAYRGNPYIVLYGPGYNGKRIPVSGGDYKEYCTPSGTWNSGHVPSVLNNTGSGNVIAVSAIYVNEVQPQTPPKTCSKNTPC